MVFVLIRDHLAERTFFLDQLFYDLCLIDTLQKCVLLVNLNSWHALHHLKVLLLLASSEASSLCYFVCFL